MRYTASYFAGGAGFGGGGVGATVPPPEGLVTSGLGGTGPSLLAMIMLVMFITVILVVEGWLEGGGGPQPERGLWQW